ncbi:hypothetical protein M5585_08140 [Serratia ureilytica]
MGGIIAPPLIIYLAQKWGWSMAFHLTAVPGIILAWLIYRYVNGKKDPLSAPRRRPTRRRTKALTASCLKSRT